MQDERNRRASDRIRVDLIEADIDMAFGLVHDAVEAFREGNSNFARSKLQEAQNVLADIDARLNGLVPGRLGSLWAAGEGAAEIGSRGTVGTWLGHFTTKAPIPRYPVG